MIPIKLSNRARNTPASPIRRLAHLDRKAQAAGRTVYHLNIGQPDIKTPQEFLDGVKLYSDDVVAYETSEGNDLLRTEWVKYMNKTLDLNIPREQMLITTGASEALVFTFMTCCDPGDEILIFDPTYANYISFAAISGIELVAVLTKLKHNFALPPVEDIVDKITNRTRALLLCNPNNPTGSVYTREELQTILDICEEQNIFLIVDETYRELVFDGLKPLSILHLAPNNDRIIVIDSLSKRFSLCGARIGCLITSNQKVLAKTLNLLQARLASPSIEQFAAAYMLGKLPEDFVDNIRIEYESRRDTLYHALTDIPGVELLKSKGAFYTVVRLPFKDAEKFASFLLSDFSHNNATVFVAPASGFYMANGSGSDKIRIAYVLNNQDLEISADLFAKGLEVYQNR